MQPRGLTQRRDLVSKRYWRGLWPNFRPGLGWNTLGVEITSAAGFQSARGFLDEAAMMWIAEQCSSDAERQNCERRLMVCPHQTSTVRQVQDAIIYCLIPRRSNGCDIVRDGPFSWEP